MLCFESLHIIYDKNLIIFFVLHNVISILFRYYFRIEMLTSALTSELLDMNMN